MALTYKTYNISEHLFNKPLYFIESDGCCAYAGIYDDNETPILWKKLDVYKPSNICSIVDRNKECVINIIDDGKTNYNDYRVFEEMPIDIKQVVFQYINYIASCNSRKVECGQNDCSITLYFDYEYAVNIDDDAYSNYESFIGAEQNLFLKDYEGDKRIFFDDGELSQEFYDAFSEADDYGEASSVLTLNGYFSTLNTFTLEATLNLYNDANGECFFTKKVKEIYIDCIKEFDSIFNAINVLLGELDIAR